MKNTPKIQLLYFPGCPNLGAARKALKNGLVLAGLENHGIEEINTKAPGTPKELQNYPSPTILINGREMEGSAPGEAPACRIYDGVGGVPGVEKIAAALKTALGTR